MFRQATAVRRVASRLGPCPLRPCAGAWRTALPRHEFSGHTPYVKDTVTVLSQDLGTVALGTALGSREHINTRAWKSARASDDLRSAVTSVEHASSQMVFPRQCADVSKLMCHRCTNGDVLDYDLLVSFDGQLRALVSTFLRWQATTGVSFGGLGLGLRTAIGVALPAFVAIRISSHPLVATKMDHFRAAFGVSLQTLMESPRSAPRSPRCCSPNSTRPLLNASFCGKICSRSAKTPRVAFPLRPLTTGTTPMIEILLRSRRGHRAVQCVHSVQVCGQVGSLWPSLPHSRQNISYTPIVWGACVPPHQDTLAVSCPLSKPIAPKRNFVSDVVFLRLHSSVTLETLRAADSHLLASSRPSCHAGGGSQAQSWGPFAPPSPGPCLASALFSRLLSGIGFFLLNGSHSRCLLLAASAG